MALHSTPDIPLEGEDTKKIKHGDFSRWVKGESRFRFILLFFAILITFPLLIKSQNNRSSSVNSATPVVFFSSSSSTLVSISGDVKHPGIYAVNASTMTMSVIKMAEPISRIALFLPDGIELLPVNNGSNYNVSINSRGYANVEQKDIPASQRILLKIPLEINSMSATDLESLPGIGPVLSRKIIEYRHKNGGKMKFSDLIMVEGIGEKKYLQLEEYFKPLKKQEENIIKRIRK